MNAFIYAIGGFIAGVLFGVFTAALMAAGGENGGNQNNEDDLWKL